MEFHPDSSVIYDERLREKAAGDFEGRPKGTIDQFAKALGIPIREYRPEGGESWEDVKQRCKAFQQSLFDTYLDPARSTPARVLVISHGGWIKEFLSVLGELQPEVPVYDYISKNTALYIFQVTQPHGQLLITATLQNDVSHLSSLEESGL